MPRHAVVYRAVYCTQKGGCREKCVHTGNYPVPEKKITPLPEKSLHFKETHTTSGKITPLPGKHPTSGKTHVFLKDGFLFSRLCVFSQKWSFSQRGDTFPEGRLFSRNWGVSLKWVFLHPPFCIQYTERYTAVYRDFLKLIPCRAVYRGIQNF